MAGELPPTETKLPLEDLVKNYITGRREAYLEQGRQVFREHRYRKAYDIFGLADAVSLDDPKARSSVKLAMLYAGIASQQYVQAIKDLRWLLTPDSRTGQLPDPLFLTRISDVRSLYGGDRADAANIYAGHVRAVEDMVIQNPASGEAQALHAFALWQNQGEIGARADALFRARRIAAEPAAGEPWRNLYQVMQNAEAASRGEGAGQEAEPSSSESASSLLPFELPVTE